MQILFSILDIILFSLLTAGIVVLFVVCLYATTVLILATLKSGLREVGGRKKLH